MLMTLLTKLRELKRRKGQFIATIDVDRGVGKNDIGKNAIGKIAIGKNAIGENARW